ncbi:MAG: hypothetical protein NT141_02360 [candidate division WWE3 bacterium]|nr:hypothetical protein [candidate division WWE3 bacterium]
MVIYLIGGKNKTSSRKALLEVKKNFPPEAVQTIVIDKNFAGPISSLFNSQSLLSEKTLIVAEMATEWKKYEEELLKTLNKTGVDGVDAVLWIDGSLPKNSKLLKSVADLGGQVTFFDDEVTAQIWGLLDALGAKNRPRAFEELQTLLAQGESAIGILVMITYLTRNLLSVKYKNKLAESLSPFQKRKLTTAAKNFTEMELLEIYSQLLTVDMALKGSSLSDDLLLTNLIIHYTTYTNEKPLKIAG